MKTRPIGTMVEFQKGSGMLLNFKNQKHDDTGRHRKNKTKEEQSQGTNVLNQAIIQLNLWALVQLKTASNMEKTYFYAQKPSML